MKQPPSNKALNYQNTESTLLLKYQTASTTIEIQNQNTKNEN